MSSLQVGKCSAEKLLSSITQSLVEQRLGVQGCLPLKSAHTHPAFLYTRSSVTTQLLTQ